MAGSTGRCGTLRDVASDARASRPERLRLARDLHDVVAHTLTVVVVQSVGVELARVVQEALTNVVRHSAAGEAVVQLIGDDGQVTVIVEDPGPALSSGLRFLLEDLPRQHRVDRLVAKWHTNTEIAGELFLSESTVKARVGRLLQKLSVRDRVQLVSLAYESVLVG